MPNIYTPLGRKLPTELNIGDLIEVGKRKACVVKEKPLLISYLDGKPDVTTLGYSDRSLPVYRVTQLEVETVSEPEGTLHSSNLLNHNAVLNVLWERVQQDNPLLPVQCQKAVLKCLVGQLIGVYGYPEETPLPLEELPIRITRIVNPVE